MQYALLLSNICSKVNLVIMFDKFLGDENLVKAVESRKNIEITNIAASPQRFSAWYL